MKALLHKILRLWKWILAALLLMAVAAFAINRDVVHEARPYETKNLDSLPTCDAALVLGAKVFTDGALAMMTLDRANTALALYKAHKVKKILISGDHGHEYYDEVNSIRKYILSQGVPPEDVFMDHAGFDTYSSMYRARDVFQVKSLIICTQQFHLDRAVFLARNMGLQAWGVPADHFPYQTHYLLLREKGARIKAFFAAKITHPKPHFLGEVISIEGDGRRTEDGR